MTPFRLAAVAICLATAAPQAAVAAPVQASVAVHGDQARDRAAILAMAGTYKVRFDMRETTPLVAGYTPYPAKISGGYEVVRAIVDTPERIVLQHILVVGDETTPIVVKHWRQDWVWQPAEVLVYVAPGQWSLRQVPAAERAGAWSQTVWQTDDSPRYGAVGRWRYDGGVTRWSGGETRRPLARRDATRHPPYDHYLGVNHHVLTPNGWVHEQENAKRGAKDGATVTFVHEYVVNTYAPDATFDAGAADRYWAKTRDYWAAVRAGWDAAVARDGGLKLAEEPDAGSSTGGALMGLADRLAAKTITLAAAKAQAAAVIARRGLAAEARAKIGDRVARQ